MAPQFSGLFTVLISLGVAVVIPHIRGGGGYGKSWHEDGRARKKGNAVDDFVSAAEWLCKKDFTSPERIAAIGGSNAV